MADTGFEHVRPIPAVEWSRKLVAKFDLPLTVVRNPNKTYLEMVERRGK
jgi:DNA sulfur modification protein DndC